MYNGDTVSGVTLNSSGAAATANVAGSPYSIVPSSAVGSGLGNYNINYVNGSLTVNVAPLTITATNQSKIYGSTLTLGTTGFTTSTLFNGDTVTGVTLNSSGAAGTAVVSGSPYSIIPSSAVGTGLGNYNINYVNASLTVNKATLTVTATNQSKTYGSALTLGTTGFTTGTLFNGDTVTGITLNSSGAAATANVTGSPYSIIPSSAVGTGLGNYNITYANGSLTVNKAPLTVTATNQTNTYGNSSLVASDFTSSGLQNGETIGGVTLSTNATTSTSGNYNAGTWNITPNAATAGSFNPGNYSISYASGTLIVNPAVLTINASGVNKVYDGGTTATVSLSDNRIAGDVLTDNYTSATFANQNVGTATSVNVGGISISGHDAGNYTLANTTAVTSANITPKPLTIIGITATNKVYDGITTATIDTSAASLTGLVSGDNVTLSTVGATGTFVSKNVGTAVTVDVTGLSISGTAAGNYTLTGTSAVTSANITPAPLTITASNQTNTYGNSNLGTTAFISSGLQNGESIGSVTLGTNATTSTSGNDNAGTWSITPGLAAGGTFTPSNYSIAYAPGTLIVNPATLTVSATGINKVYNGTNTATVNLTDNRVAGDVLNDSYTSATFTNQNVVGTETVNANGISISGHDAGNYTLSNTSAVTTASITPAPLTITSANQTKAYGNSNLGTTAFTSSGLQNSETVGAVTFTTNATTSASGNDNAGTWSITSSTATGGTFNLGNYTITYAPGTLTVNPATLTVSGITANKVYDGTTTATLNTSAALLSGVVFGDTVNLVTTGVTAAFNSKDVLAANTVTVTGLGVNSSNYTLTQPTITASISPAPLTVTATNQTKTYGNSNLGTTAFTTSGLQTGDAINSVILLSTNATTSTSGNDNVGTWNITPSAASGNSFISSNYSISYTPGTLTVNPATLTITGITASNKVYDGTTTAAINTSSANLQGLINTDNVILSVAGATGTFVNKNAGSGVTVDVTGLSISGADAGNYALTGTSAVTSANITPAPLTITASNQTNTYGNSNLGTLAFISSGLQNGESIGSVTLGTNATTSTSGNDNAGTWNIAPSAPTGGTFSPTNYSITYAPGILIVNPAILTVSATGVNKVYDGTTTAAVTLSDNRVAGDVLTDSYTSATFTNQNVVGAETVNANGISISGHDAGNYTIANTTAVTSASITPKALTISGLSAPTKVYDGTTTAVLNGTPGLLNTENAGSGSTIDGTPYSGDTVSITGTTSGTYNSKDVGTATTITYTGLSLTGPQAANYTLVAQVAGTITPKPLTMSGLSVPNSKVYDGTTTATVSGMPILTGSETVGSGTNSDGESYTGDQVNITGAASGTYDSKDVNNATSVTFGGLSLTGAQANDYTLTIQNPAAATITPRSITVTATGVNKIFDGTNTATVILSDNRVAGDSLSDNYSSATFTSSSVGTDTINVTGISISGLDASNYALLNTTAVATASIFSNVINSQLASSLPLPTGNGGFGQLFFSSYNPPAPGVYFYHPISDIDLSAFDNSNDLQLGNDVFDFIDGRVSIVGH